MNLFNRFIVFALIPVMLTGFAIKVQSAEPFSLPLQVNLYPDQENGNKGVIQFEITNTSTQVIKIPPWLIPSRNLSSDLFDVFSNGEKIAYDGIIVKRGITSEGKYFILRSGETKHITVDLSTVYDMTMDGLYTVRFKTSLQEAKTGKGQKLIANKSQLALLRSPELDFFVRSAPPTISNMELQTYIAQSQTGGNGGKVVNGITYVGCSGPKKNQKNPSQIEIAGNAIIEARKYSEEALSNLQTYQGSNPRYISWFRVVTYQQISAILLTVITRMYNISEALHQSAGEITIDCSCRDGTIDDYGYVRPSVSYVIYLCPKFWDSTTPLIGTDSQAGTQGNRI
jgi:peptidyl-Lys metalloendopeptidase